jgi:hypothetical protein
MTRRFRLRLRWGHCVNCREYPVPGCLCRGCLRAALVPLVLFELVRVAFSVL